MGSIGSMPSVGSSSGIVEVLSKKVLLGKVHLFIKATQENKIATYEITGYFTPYAYKPVLMVNNPGTLTNPNNTGNVYPINTPQGMTSGQFISNIQNEVANYNLPNYAWWGPNSNTFIDNVIEGAGGQMPDIPGAVGQNNGESPSDATGPTN